MPTHLFCGPFLSLCLAGSALNMANRQNRRHGPLLPPFTSCPDWGTFLLEDVCFSCLFLLMWSWCCGWTKSCTCLKPWLKPLFLGVYRRVSIPGCVGGARWISSIHVVAWRARDPFGAACAAPKAAGHRALATGACRCSRKFV